MPNEEAPIPGNPNELLLQLVSALINQGQPQGGQPTLHAQATGSQQPHGMPTGAIQPQSIFPGFGGAVSSRPSGFTVLPPRSQQLHQQLPHVGSTVDLEPADYREDHQYTHAGSGSGSASAAQRQERIRLKNRLAQQRFRERRRTQQREFDRIGEEYDAIELENDELREQQQALFKIFHVQQSLLEILRSKGELTPEDEIKHSEGGGTTTEMDFKMEQQGDVAKDEAGISVEKATTALDKASNTPESRIPLEKKIDISAPGVDDEMTNTTAPLASSLQKFAHETEVFTTLQAWQLRLGQLMEKGASAGFPAEDIQNLEMVTQHQLAKWQELAQTNSLEYSKLLKKLLAPLNMRSPSNNGLAAGTVCPETLAAVVAGISESGIAELQKINSSYETNLSMGYKALQDWKKELLPLLVLSCPNINAQSLQNPASGGMSLGARELANRHLMAVFGISKLYSHENKVWDAVSLIGPAWSRISGPLNAALCHLEVSPYLPSPDSMASSILVAHALAQKNQQSNQYE